MANILIGNLPTYSGDTTGVFVVMNDSGNTTINRPPYGSIRFVGAINGQISNLMYTRYALSFGEIENLLNKGASNVIKQTTKETPPYLADSWWSDQ